MHLNRRKDEMKILMNGIYRGGNCPPYYKQLKKLGHDVKVVDILFFKGKYTVEYESFEREDLIIPNYSIVSKFLFKAYKLSKITYFLRGFVNYAKGILSSYEPDLVINHRITTEALILLKTCYKPQVSLVYGSEIIGKQLLTNEVEFIFAKSMLILTTSEEEVREINNAYLNTEGKAKCLDWGLFNCNEIMSKMSDANRSDFRNKWFGSKDYFVISDLRSLRNSGVARNLILGIERLAKTRRNILLVLVKGYLGKDIVISEAQQLIKQRGLEKNIILIEKILSEEEKIELLIASDALTSLLPNDSLGTIILEGGLTKNLLILTNLEQYKRIFGQNAIYIDKLDPTTISFTLKKYFDSPGSYNIDDVYSTINSRFNSDFCFVEINNELKKLVN